MAKKNLLQKFWIELTRVRSIDFTSYLTEEEYDEKLAKELKERIRYFRETNSERIIKQIIIPNVRRMFFRDTGMIMTEKDALDMAVEFFLLYKQNGKIDELNNINHDCEVL